MTAPRARAALRAGALHPPGLHMRGPCDAIRTLQSVGVGGRRTMIQESSRRARYG